MGPYMRKKPLVSAETINLEGLGACPGRVVAGVTSSGGQRTAAYASPVDRNGPAYGRAAFSRHQGTSTAQRHQRRSQPGVRREHPVPCSSPSPTPCPNPSAKPKLKPKPRRHAQNQTSRKGTFCREWALHTQETPRFDRKCRSRGVCRAGADAPLKTSQACRCGRSSPRRRRR